MRDSNQQNHNDDPFHDDLISNISALLSQDNPKDSRPHPPEPKNHRSPEDKFRLSERVFPFRIRIKASSEFDSQIYADNSKTNFQELRWLSGQHVKTRISRDQMVFA
jgi:hypothetical protein